MEQFATSPEFLSISLAQGRVAPVENYIQERGNPDASISGRPFSSVFPLIFYSCGISYTIIDQSSSECFLVPDKRPEPGSLNGFFRATGTLLSAGANPNASAVVSTIVDDDAILEVVHMSQVTPLMIAALHGDFKTCRILLASGADETAKDSLGKTYIDYAKRSKLSSDVIALSESIPQVIPHTPTNIQFSLSTSTDNTNYWGTVSWQYNPCLVRDIICKRRGISLLDSTTLYKLSSFVIRIRDNRDRLKVVRYQVSPSESSIMTQTSVLQFSHIMSDFLCQGYSYSLTISSVWKYFGKTEVELESFQSPASLKVTIPTSSSSSSCSTRKAPPRIDLQTNFPLIDALVHSPNTSSMTRIEPTSPWSNHLTTQQQQFDDASENSTSKLVAWHAASQVFEGTVRIIDVFAVASASLSIVCNGSSSFDENVQDEVVNSTRNKIMDDVLDVNDDDDDEEFEEEEPVQASPYDCIVS